MANILVTGGAGYIGSHVAKALAQAGFTPVTYDNLSTGNGWAVRWGPLERGNILDAARLDAVFRAYEPVGVVHLAALSLVGESFSEARRYHRVNVDGTLNLSNACARHGNVPLVFSSTCAVYGVPNRLPLTETAAKRPVSPYGETKLAAEAVLAEADARSGLRSLSLRYFNAAGADPSGELGEHRRHESHLVPLAFQALAGHRPPLTVFGNDYATADGTAVRDYVHVTDLGRAHVAAVSALLEGHPTSALNIGTGRGHTVQEVLEAVAACARRPVPFEFGSRRSGDPARLFADATAALRTIGFSTGELSALDSIVRTAWSWFEKVHRFDFAPPAVANEA